MRYLLSIRRRADSAHTGHNTARVPSGNSTLAAGFPQPSHGGGFNVTKGL